MCENCGCINPAVTNESSHIHNNVDRHDHTHGMKIEIGIDVMKKNEDFAKKNREVFNKNKLLAFNIISSPGSGKTSIIEAMARKFGDAMAVVVGDLQTKRDAERIIQSGSRAHQIETGGACHLDAHSVGHAVEHIDISGVQFLVIENVGNLVCPAAYNLGEHLKIAILSTPEGDDKILKYPSIFSKISLLVINKIDLSPHLDFDTEKAINECRSLNGDFEVFKISAKTGAGIDELIEYLIDMRAEMYRDTP